MLSFWTREEVRGVLAALEDMADYYPEVRVEIGQLYRAMATAWEQGLTFVQVDESWYGGLAGYQPGSYDTGFGAAVTTIEIEDDGGAAGMLVFERSDDIGGWVTVR